MPIQNHSIARSVSRRDFLALPLGLAGAVVAGEAAGARLSAAERPQPKTAAGLAIAVGEHRVVTREAVREPQLFKLRSGDLLLTFHVQPDRHFAERRGMRSSDGGRTWRAEPKRGHREQAIGQGADGTVLAPDIYTFERRPGEYVGSFFRSTDGGATFAGPFETVVRVNRVASEAYPTPEHFPPEGHPLRKFYQPLPAYYDAIVRQASERRGPTFWRYLVERDGHWLTAMHCHFHADGGYRTILVDSRDGGKTWSFVSTIAYRYLAPGDGFCEPALMWVPDGSLLCVMRCGGKLPLAQCRSLDQGKTWSTPEPLPGHGVDPDLHLMSNGVLACTFGRPGLHLMFSLDGCGRKWSHLTPIGEWRSSTYMGIAEVAPNELLLVYDRNESPVGVESDPAKSYIGSTLVRVTRAAPTE
ncbi:MAG: hypothetical protein RL077_687 [Verrucomicrobiota bacterium]